jgi:hypothetical protein
VGGGVYQVKRKELLSFENALFTPLTLKMQKYVNPWSEVRESTAIDIYIQHNNENFPINRKVRTKKPLANKGEG